jgi:predicted phage terminase large subunit-like protein
LNAASAKPNAGKLESVSETLTTTQSEKELALFEELESRRRARQSFLAWCERCGCIPAKHHRLVIDKLQEITDSKVARFVIFMMPPGAAKSTYTSKTFPPWFLGRRIEQSPISKPCILACSYSKDLAAKFGRDARNLLDDNENVLGYSLRGDSKAADEWETTNGGRYFCAGVGAGIAGHRADLGLIDDYLGNQEDADSKTVRDKQWDWFWGDFFPRLKPGASLVIIANRRHEDDLIGRLLNPDNASTLPIHPSKWEVISLPFFAEENDVLGRSVGERLWPEWYTEEQAAIVRKLPGRVRAGLWQQRPRPEDGDYFQAAWLRGYEPEELPPLSSLQIYGGGDFACSEEEGANKTCLPLGGWDGRTLWILPKLYWKREDTGKMARAWLALNEEFNPLIWWAEKGHISKSIGPFMRAQMVEQMNFLRIEEVTPSKDKPSRARSFQGMCEFGLVRFPKFASWWDKAENDLLTFPGGSEDDLIDALAHLGAGVHRLCAPHRIIKDEDETPKNDGRFVLTARQLKADMGQKKFYDQLAALDR